MSKIEVATLGGGCFWCLEAVFDEVKGVTDVVSGYAGGDGANPSYEAVCSGNTGHAEVVQVGFDPAIISYKEILMVFFAIHDPTTLNRQGNDSGSQYRSVIFTHTPEQAKVANESIAYLIDEKIWDDAIVTQISPAATFYPAEEHHQEFFKRNPYQGYCMAIVSPKVNKFRKNFTKLLKSE